MDKSIEYVLRHVMELLDSKWTKVEQFIGFETEMFEICNVFFSKRFINRCIPEKSSYQVNSFFSKTGVSEFFQVILQRECTS